MKIMAQLILFLVFALTINLSSAIALEDKKEMVAVQYYDDELERLKSEAEGISECLGIARDAIDKARSGDYLIIYPMIPVKKHDYEMTVADSIFNAAIGTAHDYTIYGRPEYIKGIVRYTKFIRENGDSIIEKFNNELDKKRKEQERCIRERDRILALTAQATPTAGPQPGVSIVPTTPPSIPGQTISNAPSIPPLTGGQGRDVAYLYLVGGEPEVTWATEDRFYRDRYINVNVGGCSVTYAPDPKNISVHGSFKISWDEPPRLIGRDGFDWKFKAEIESMPKGNDGCGVEVTFSDIFRAAGVRRWVGIGSDGKLSEGGETIVKLQPNIDDLRGETDGWINIRVYECSITYKYKITRDAAPPLGIR